MPELETAKIITLSIAHLHPETRAAIQAERGDMPEGPSIAIRDEGFLVNSHLGVADALEADFRSGLYRPLAIRYPELATIRAFARGQEAAWINFDVDGPVHSEMFPVFDDNGFVELPTDPAWAELLKPEFQDHLLPPRAALEALEEGRTPVPEPDAPAL